MSTAGHSERPTRSASDIAGMLREAEFVRLIGAGDGDALAALGVLAGVLDESGTPYQATVAPIPVDASRVTEADLTVALGRETAGADLTVGLDDSASQRAYEAAAQMGSPDPVLALAGYVASGGVPEGPLLEDARAAGVERRPGVAVPTTDHVDGLAHSTLVHGSFSGDADRTRRLLDGITGDTETDRAVASLVALDVAGDEAATVRGARTVERVLAPYAGGPFETVGGYADVLDALARAQPGLGVALALGTGDHDRALAAWRDHGNRVHEAIRTGTTGRYDGLFVVRCDGAAPVGTVARLVRDFRSPEPVVLVVADGSAAAVGTADAPETDLGATMRTAATAVGGTGGGTTTRGRAKFETAATEFVVAVREAL